MSRRTDRVKNQRAREEQTVTVATALAAFLGTLAIGIVVLLIIGMMTEMSQAFDAGFPWAVGVAALAGAAYLGRHRK